jgi:hypothetical protein
MVEKGLLLPEGETNRLYYRLNPLGEKLTTAYDINNRTIANI